MRADLSGGIPPASTRVMNLAHFLTDIARRHPDAAGFLWGDQGWTWSQIETRSAAFAEALARRHGVQKGDRVLVQSANSNQMVEAMYACWRLGAIWVPANFRQTPDEVAWLAGFSQARVLLVGPEFPAHAAACAPHVDATVTLGDAYEALITPFLGQSRAAVAVNRDDPCWFFFTSGTTGRPKAAVLTHGQMGFVVTNHLCDLMPGTGPDWGSPDASLIVAPLSHGAGIHLMAQVAHGVPSVLPVGTKLDPAEIWSLVERHRITNLFTVPTIVKLLVEHPAVDAHDHSSLRHVIYAGAPMYRADQKRALEKLGRVLVQYFGLGEVTGSITVLPREMHSADDDDPNANIGSCGRARTGMEVAIFDAQMRRLPPGEVGEICCRGPAVFAGYHANPEATAKALAGGWFHTGDLGRIDERGLVYITGRESDMYISGGSNVYPREVEEVLLTHPAIAEVAVLGVPDAKWGEVGVAVIVQREGTARLDAAAVLAHLEGRTAKYRWPRHVFFWDALPKSGYGKIAKKDVRERLYERGNLAKP